LVRLHRLDENNAKDISGILGFLREIQRTYHVAIVLAHHSSKRGSQRPGQGLRGSSDLHAFGDSNVYLQRQGQEIEVTIEHRSAPNIDPFFISLTGNEESLHLEPLAQQEEQEHPIKARILDCLKTAEKALTRAELRQALRVNNQKLGHAISELTEEKSIVIESSLIKLPNPTQNPEE
jgi:hypothetical protein